MDLTWLARQAGAAPLTVAHRGASAGAPENTLTAFQLALDQGAAAVECDIHLSADGVPVVIHDTRVDRTTDGSGEVASLTLAQLRALDAGGWFGVQFGGERIPTLEETLALCAARARLFIELKRGGGAALVQAALAVIDAVPEAKVAIIGFGPDEVRHVAQRRPDLPLGLLIGRAALARHGALAALAATREVGAGFLGPQHEGTECQLVELAHAAQLPVSVWTVDDPDRIRHLAEIGVDAITTNRPDLALRSYRA